MAKTVLKDKYILSSEFTIKIRTQKPEKILFKKSGEMCILGKQMRSDIQGQEQKLMIQKVETQ